MYKAPLKELRFVMHELMDDQQLAGLPGFSEYSTDFADSVLEEAARFAEEVLAADQSRGRHRRARGGRPRVS